MRMGRSTGMKVGGFVLAMVFCIFFGVSMVTSGTERIHGPLQEPGGSGAKPASKLQAQSYNAAPAGGRPTGAAPAGERRSAQTQSQASTDPAAAGSIYTATAEPVPDTGINRVGNKLGDLLEITARHGIRFVVSLIEAILD